MDLILMLMTLLLQINDVARLERAVNQLARLDPRYPALPMLRAVLTLMKTTPGRSGARSGMPPL